MTTLAGRRIAVTGATGGIGRHLVATLAGAGARVAATGSSTERLAALAAEVPTALTHRADIREEGQVEHFFETAAIGLGGLDAVVVLAGASVPGLVAETTTQTVRDLLDVNVTGAFLACKYAAARLDDAGQVIVMSSMAGLRANATAPLYCTAKAAVAMFAKAFALQVKERGLRVTTLSPGGVDTPFWGDRPVDRTALMSAADVTDTVVWVLTRPRHVVVHDLQFESSGVPRAGTPGDGS